MESEATLTIPKQYDPGDAKAAEGIATLTLPMGTYVEVQRSGDERAPSKPVLRYAGRTAYGVDQFREVFGSTETPDGQASS